jgi:hypothetical protein
VINPIVAISALFLIGLEEPAQEFASDVTEASIEVNESVADAR